jgi:hypothetical protein
MTKTSTPAKFTTEFAADMTVQYKTVSKVRLVELVEDFGRSQSWKVIPLTGPAKFRGVETVVYLRTDGSVQLY